jgi:polysaccharide biosynthesis protein PslG
MCQTYFDLHSQKLSNRPSTLRRIAATLVFLLCSMVIGCGGGTASNSASTPPVTINPITPGSVFFGMHINRAVPGEFPYPTIPFGSYRTLDSNLLWSDIETSPGNYDFSRLNTRLSYATGVDVVYTIYNTPAFYSSSPNDTNCASYGNNGALGGCDPPNDVNPDGSGADQHLINFLTALAKDAAAQPNPIKYYEIWNEVNITTEWTGTDAQLVRMAQDMRNTILAVNPNAQFLSPSFADLAYIGAGAAAKMATYLGTSANGTTGSAQADIINFHGYVYTNGNATPQAENEVLIVQNILAALTNAGDTTDLAKPLWDTEFSYGPNGLGDPDLNAAFIASHLLIQAGQGVARTYYFDWDISEQEALWSNTLSSTGPCLGVGVPNNVGSTDGFLCETGIAYQQVETWLTGNTVTTPCSGPMPPNAGVWTCGITKADGSKALVVWDSSQTCSNGNCTSSTYSFTGPFTNFLTLTSGSTSSALGGSTVQVGVQPILLQ